MDCLESVSCFLLASVLRLAVFVPLAAFSRDRDGLRAGGIGPTARGSAPGLAIGKQLYRKYCGQCHALTEALAAGSGSDQASAPDGGPNFNNLDVPFGLSIVAVTEQFGGHELVVKKMKWASSPVCVRRGCDGSTRI